MKLSLKKVYIYLGEWNYFKLNTKSWKTVDHILFALFLLNDRLASFSFCVHWNRHLEKKVSGSDYYFWKGLLALFDVVTLHADFQRYP